MARTPSNPAQEDSMSDDNMLAIVLMMLVLAAAAWFFGKDAIIAYWKGLSFVWISALNFLDPHFAQQYGDMDLTFLHQVPIAKIHWKAANLINRSIDRTLSAWGCEFWPIFWSILPALLAIPLWNKKKGLHIQFNAPWDLARYLSAHYAWMLPVMRERQEALKHQWKKKKTWKENLKDLQFRDRASDWPLHPLEILLSIQALSIDGELQEKPIEAWSEKQLGAKAGRDGFSTPARNALFHAFVHNNTQAILKSYAKGGNAVIHKHTRLSGTDVGAFKKYREKHGYEVTILLSVLHDARKRGLVPPNWFVWLKYQDRPLWYALHALGLPRPHSEGLPGMVQWHCELKAHAPVLTVQSQFVASGLWESIEETQWRKSKAWKAYVH